MCHLSLRTIVVSAVLSFCAVVGASNVASAAPAEVQTLRAAKFPMSYHGMSWINYSYTIAVKNLAYEKSVIVWGQKADGTWTGVAASYAGPLGGGYEKWELHTNDGFDTFVVRYDVLGRTYWDNNDGRNYRIVGTGVNLYNDKDVLQYSAYRYDSNVSVSVNLRNLAYTKQVNVVYTTDGWRTVLVAPLQFFSYQQYGYGSAPSPNEAGVEFWSGSFNAYGTIEYAISYDVAGTTYWDNNFGSNYSL